jgi:hypothetical protein
MTSELDKYFDNSVGINSFSLKKKLFAANLKEKKCEECNLDSWRDLPIPLELHHKNGNSKDNSLSNLQILCPNCHALTHNYRASNFKKLAIKKSISEILAAIADSYNARQTLLKLGYAPKGGNYQRIYSTMEKYDVKFRQPTEEEIAKNRELQISNLSKTWENKRSKARKEGREITKTKKTGLSREETWLRSRKVERPTGEELLEQIWKRSVSQIAKELGVCDNSVRKWAKQYNIPVPPVGYWAKWNNKHFDECEQIKKELFDKFGL